MGRDKKQIWPGSEEVLEKLCRTEAAPAQGRDLRGAGRGAGGASGSPPRSASWDEGNLKDPATKHDGSGSEHARRGRAEHIQRYSDYPGRTLNI